MVIYLIHKLLYDFSGVRILASNVKTNTFTLLRMGFAWTKFVAKLAVSSCLAFSSLLTTQGYSGYFLLHFPSSCLDLPLASILLYEARTFLKWSSTCDHLTKLTLSFYHRIKICQYPLKKFFNFFCYKLKNYKKCCKNNKMLNFN